MTHTYLINKIIKERGYKSYLEIGVEDPNANYNLIECANKEGVDPYVDPIYISKEAAEAYAQHVTYRMTSDKFFSIVNKKYDCIFIDGLHKEEQCDRDIWNAMHHLTGYGCVIVHDCIPLNEEMQHDEPTPGKPWTGTVWKSVLKLIRMGLPVQVLDHDYGIAVIEKCFYPMPKKSGFAYEDKFKKVNMNITYTIDNYVDVVSYYTPLYKTTLEMVKRAYKSLKQQTDPRWEWVVLADSLLDSQVAYRLQEICNTDSRVKYYTIKPNSFKCVGEAKYRASLLTHGYLVAELDHDDMLMPEMTATLKSAARNRPRCGFFYTDCVECDSNYQKRTRYPEGFGMGYGSYRTESLVNPYTDELQLFDVINGLPINPGTIRHIVGVPNHIRCWRRDVLFGIGGYNRNLPIADDYELLVRTFLNTIMCHIPQALYIQVMHGDNTQNSTRAEIQTYVHAIANTYHKQIASRFKQLGRKDWLFDKQPYDADQCWLNSPGGSESDVNEVFI